MQAWFLVEEPILGRVSCVPTSLPVGFPNQGLGYIPQGMQNGPL